MALIEINSFFTRNGIPATDIDNLNPHPDGLNYPRVRIWKVSGSTTQLIIGDPTGSGQQTDGIMVPVVDTVEDGFYTYVFDDNHGYDTSAKYLVRVDGGPSLADTERYQVSEIDPIENNIIDGVWDEQITNHLSLGSTGLTLSQIKANTDLLYLNVTDVLNIVKTILKYDTNRTKIDTVANVMIIYDDDCVTELRRFELLDATGAPNSDSVCERKPIAATDNKPVCT